MQWIWKNLRIFFIIDRVIRFWKNIVISPICAPMFLNFGVWLLTGTEIICVKIQVHILAGSGDMQLEEGTYSVMYEAGHD